MAIYAKIGVIVLVLVSAFGAGYHVSNLTHDSEQLAQLTEQQAITRELLRKESEVAAVVERRLSNLRANERVIERTRVEVVDRPIYSIECLDDDGLALIERYATRREEEAR